MGLASAPILMLAIYFCVWARIVQPEYFSYSPKANTTMLLAALG